MIPIWSFFSDPVLQAPTIGSMLLSTAAALVGVIAFVRRQSLVGEVLSHASYPGIVLAVLFLAFFFPSAGDFLWIFVLFGALVFSLLGAFLLAFIQRKLRVNNDASLCLILSSFLGIGVLLSSRLQIVHPKWFGEVQVFLCGQAATMRDDHLYLYGALLVAILAMVVLFFEQIRISSFDRYYAKLNGIYLSWIDAIIMGFFALAVIMGVRGVGIVLIAGMLVAPAIAARSLTHRLSRMFIIAAIIGGASGFGGNVISVYLSYFLMDRYPGWRVSLPTGPMIVSVAALIVFVTTLIAPREGLFVRLGRIVYFRFRCFRENILKFLWKRKGAGVSFVEIHQAHHTSSIFLWLILQTLKIEKNIKRSSGSEYYLLPKGKERADHIVRLHRLWELYLHRHLGISGEKVHSEAEEMEHIITPEIEKELIELLDNPATDPHNQPIPKKGSD